MDNERKRHSDQMGETDTFQQTPRKAMRKETLYEQLRYEKSSHTIPLATWDAHCARENIEWDKPRKHKILDDLKPEVKKRRRGLIVDIQKVTGTRHVYYLCIPVERRPARDLPEDVYNCSTIVLKTIRDILKSLENQAEDTAKLAMAKVTYATDVAPKPPTNGINTGNTTTLGTTASEQGAQVQHQPHVPGEYPSAFFQTPPRTPAAQVLAPEAPMLQPRQAPQPPRPNQAVRGSHENPLSIAGSPTEQGRRHANVDRNSPATPSMKRHDEEVEKARRESEVAAQRYQEAQEARLEHLRRRLYK